MFPDRDAGKPKIQQPRALSETAGVWTGKIVSIYEYRGKTGSREWTCYTVEGEGQVAFTTFSHTKALLAKCAKECDLGVEIQWERDTYDGKKILVIDEDKS